jgi:hypothetical protein
MRHIYRLNKNTAHLSIADFPALQTHPKINTFANYEVGAG